MERIVLGISAINFNNSNDFVTERPSISNGSIWQNEFFPHTMAAAEIAESAAEVEESLDQLELELPSSRRSLPPRSAKCKENSLLRIKRRSIMKPRRNTSTMGDAMRQSDIKKLYLENKIKGNFRPSNLETIYEEPTPDKNEQMRFIGVKKIRRSLSCSDGLNVTKTTVKTRRLKIKKTFGRRFASKKISLEAFIDKLNASFLELTKRDRIISNPLEPKKTDDPENKEGDGDMECADETLPLT